MTRINVTVADLLRASDILLAAFKGDIGHAQGWKRLAYPVTILPEYGRITLAAQLSHGVLRVTVPAELEGEGFDEFTFALGAVHESRKVLGKGQATLVIDGDTFKVEAGGATVEASTQYQRSGASLRMDDQREPARQAVFAFQPDALPWVAKAMASDDGRPALCMVSVSPDGFGGANLTAADGFRLHTADAGATVDRWDSAAPAHSSRPDPVGIPAWLVAAIGKAKPASVTVNAAWWEADDSTLGPRSRAALSAPGTGIEATWQDWPRTPDYSVVTTSIPTNAPLVVGHVADLVEALTEVKPMARDSANIFRVSNSEGNMQIEAKSTGLGRAVRTVLVNGDPFPFAASVVYWLEALGKPENGAAFSIAVDRDRVTADGTTAPIRLVSGHPWGTGIAHIMPMHIAR